MAERTAQAVSAERTPPAMDVSASDSALPAAAMAWTGTSLSTALTNAGVAEAREPESQRVLGTLDAEAESHADGASDDEGGSRADGSLDADPGSHPGVARTEPGGHGAVGAGSGAEARRGGARNVPPKAVGAALKAKHAFAATRAVARKLALQAIYRWLLNDAPWQDVVKEFGEAEDMPNADPKYFRELVEGVWASRKSLDERLAEMVDRPIAQLDPVEHAVLLVSLYELTARPDIPFRVVINEAVGLAKRFGATDGHKFVNAVLDRAARTLRPGEN
jgi:N utilization substance protein B